MDPEFATNDDNSVITTVYEAQQRIYQLCKENKDGTLENVHSILEKWTHANVHKHGDAKEKLSFSYMSPNFLLGSERSEQDSPLVHKVAGTADCPTKNSGYMSTNFLLESQAAPGLFLRRSCTFRPLFLIIWETPRPNRCAIQRHTRCILESVKIVNKKGRYGPKSDLRKNRPGRPETPTKNSCSYGRLVSDSMPQSSW